MKEFRSVRVCWWDYQIYTFTNMEDIVAYLVTSYEEEENVYTKEKFKKIISHLQQYI